MLLTRVPLEAGNDDKMRRASPFSELLPEGLEAEGRLKPVMS